jgi:MFS family permease
VTGLVDAVTEPTIETTLKAIEAQAAAATVDVAPLPPSASAQALLESQTPTATIRQSLRASTADGVFATLFTNATGGALISSFFLELGATSAEIGLLAAIPMLANLLQPLGAYLSERTTSRQLYCRWIYGVARSVWLLLAVGIGWMGWNQSIDVRTLLLWTLGITLVSHALGALGSAAWLSWMAVLVPRRLRGRYFGLRNSAVNLTNLISIPLMGLFLSKWQGGPIQGYGIILGGGIAAGFISTAFQAWMVDIDPQVIRHETGTTVTTPSSQISSKRSLRQFAKKSQQPSQQSSDLSSPPAADYSPLAFIVYFILWTFSVNLSAPFFNLYLLDSLSFEISRVTLYTSLSAAANLLLLMVWGKLADQIGNRALLLSIGVLVAITPLLWLGTGANPASIWLWFPLLHLLGGGTWAAIDLCTNNLQLGIAPLKGQSTYFGLVAAVGGISGAAGTIAGGFLASIDSMGGILGLFALSSVLRLIALLPLVFVQERHGLSLRQLLGIQAPDIEAATLK